MLRQRGQALAGIDCELAVLLGELLVHDGQSTKQGPLKIVQTPYAITRTMIISST
jgi:hypothetical protein